MTSRLKSRWAMIAKTIMWMLVLLVIFAVFAAKWASTPDRNDPALPDKAVMYLNATGPSKGGYAEGYFEHEGQNLHYVEAGEGELVLFLHGFPSYWFSLNRQMEALKGRYHVVAIDGLGAGKSDAPLAVEPYRLENMAAHLNALIDHLGAKKVHIVGHDWGSAFAIGFAQRYPDRVLSVTGISAPSQNVTLYAVENDAKSRKTASYVEQFKAANPALIVALGADKAVYDGAYRPLVKDGKLSADEGELFREATGNPRRINAHINWYRANLPSPDKLSDSDYWPAKNSRVTVPALYIWGEKDQIYSQVAIDRLKSLSDKAELLMLPEVGHWPHVRMADEVTGAIRKHLTDASLLAGSDASED